MTKEAHESDHAPGCDVEPQIRVGVPYRSVDEEVKGDREKYEKYLQAIELAGGKPVEISLRLSPAQLSAKLTTLDAVVLTGSRADVNPELYGARRHSKSAAADPDRERTDFALLEHAFGTHTPVLAICYGIQSLNVFLGGTLIQDIDAELGSAIQHEWTNREAGAPEPFHSARFEPGSRLAQLAGATQPEVNSSHHQGLRDLGRSLRVVACAPDGVVEAVEWTGDADWITGVQWHPERMIGADSLARSLFRELLGVARGAHARA
ncbi:MAG: gamma-glutamyl-gamma-aminobutyrate hydrolase family protein [Candidatus Acidiferrales bacterium]